MPAANNTNQGPWNGRFVWHDLMTKDAKTASDFYCAMFGWQIQELDMQGCKYRMIIAGPGPIGGIVEEQNIPVAHWMPYLATADVDKAAAQVKKLGGSVCVEPTDIPGTGRFAVVGDPQGAFFSLFKGLPTSQGFDPDLPVPGRVCWNELLTTDDAAAQKFYSALCGWKAESKDMGEMGKYHCQVLGDKQAGGMMKNPQNGAPSAWLVYFLVPNVVEATEKAKRLNATPMVENMPIPGIGAFSMFSDPTGAVFALFEVRMAELAPQQPAKKAQPKSEPKPAPKAAPTKTKAMPTKTLKAQPKTKAMPSKAPSKPVKKLVAKAAPKKPVAKKTMAKKPAAKKGPVKKAPAKKAMAKTTAKSRR